MCDTMVALGNATADGAVIFAKNSDREPNESQYLTFVPAENHAAGEQVQCTYRSIPQVAHTNAILLSKPFWIWGAEMGANEHGLVIGNEAVFTRLPVAKGTELIGMDYLRLALERSDSAYAAVRVITDLLAQYGQGGNCGFTHPFYYHNSFLLADRQTAWILETAGKEWAAIQVKSIGAISNALTIGSEWDLSSPDLVNFAVDQRWCKSKADFHFANCYSDRLYTPLGDGRRRQSCTLSALQSRQGALTDRDLMAYLRLHRSVDYRPDSGVTGADVCMHAGFGPVRASQTTASLIAHLDTERPLFWWTGTAAPCTSIFKPLWWDTSLPDFGPLPAGEADQSLFWKHERLHRLILKNYAERQSFITLEQQRLEARFIEQVAGKNAENRAVRQAFVQTSYEEAMLAEENWFERLIEFPDKKQNFFYNLAWNRYNDKAKLR